MDFSDGSYLLQENKAAFDNKTEVYFKLPVCEVVRRIAVVR